MLLVGLVQGATAHRLCHDAPAQHHAATAYKLAHRTDRGFGIGSTAAEIKAAYGSSAYSEPHKYVQGAEYITVWTTGAPTTPGAFVQDTNARGIRYETDAQGVVTAVHAGGASIQNVEGCS